MGDTCTLIDRIRHPIGSRDEDADQRFLASCRRRFERDGLCALPGFLTAAAAQGLVQETTAHVDDAWFCRSRHTPWLGAGDDPAASGFTSVGSVASDRFGPGSQLATLHTDAALVRFLAGVLGRDVLYPLADPLGACTVNVYGDSDGHAWHFDESDFSITLMLQEPEEGGRFEYVASDDLKRDDRAGVAAILAGDRATVKSLDFAVGTLLIFAGRHTLHRVTRVVGARRRLVPVLCYADRPGVFNSPEVQRLFWGRTSDP